MYYRTFKKGERGRVTESYRSDRNQRTSNDGTDSRNGDNGNISPRGMAVDAEKGRFHVSHMRLGGQNGLLGRVHLFILCGGFSSSNSIDIDGGLTFFEVDGHHDVLDVEIQE